MAPCIKVGKYIIKKKLGEGAFAEVRLAVHEDTGDEFAVKVFDRAAFPRADFEREVRREIKIMQYLRHPNIVAIETVLITAKKMYIVMELVRGGELYDEIVRKKRVEEPIARAYFQQIVDGMVYCHRRGVVHRDLKPENILLEGDGTVKITDFGMSWMKESIDPEEKMKELLQTQCGTPKYMPPEIIVPPTFGYDGEKLDAWECGMVLYALMAGYLPFSGTTDNAVFRSILRGKLRFPSHFSSGAIDLLTKLLEKDPKKRSTLSDIRGHSWFLVDYHGDAAKERNVAKKLSNRISEATPEGKSTCSSESRVGNYEGGATSIEEHLPFKNQANIPINIDTSSKDNLKKNRLRPITSQSSNKKPSLSLKQKVEKGALVISTNNNANVKVEPKPKPMMKLPAATGNLPNDPDEELQEIHYPSSPRMQKPSSRARDKESDRKTPGRFCLQERLPPLALKMSSKPTSETGDDDDAPSSFRNRLKSPFGAIIRSLRSSANVDDDDAEANKDQTSWFADSSPVSVVAGPNLSPHAIAATKSPSQARRSPWKPPTESAGNRGLAALTSEESQASDEPPPPTSSRALRRLAALLAKKA